jgi:hypothetical protein
MPKLQYPRLPTERKCVGGVPNPSFSWRAYSAWANTRRPRFNFLQEEQGIEAVWRVGSEEDRVASCQTVAANK